VRAIEDTGDTIAIVGTNGNALVVRRRAFLGEVERAAFVGAARSWHAAAAAQRAG
jgi:hypothetical protein